MELFDQIIANSNRNDGDIQGLQYGIVADVRDPLKLQRVQVYDQAKGGQYKSDWLLRCLPFTSYSPPIPAVGDLVIFGYISGNPHNGCYLGLGVNQNNSPVGADPDLTIVLGSTKLSIAAATGHVSVSTDGNISVLTEGNLTAQVKGNVSVSSKGKLTAESEGEMNLSTSGADITIKSGGKLRLVASEVSIEAGKATIGGKDIAVVGARDNTGDIIVDKGY